MNLYRVFEIHAPDGKFSMLFNKKSDAEAVCDWKNDCHRPWGWKIRGWCYKVKERRVYSGIKYAQTVHNQRLVEPSQRVE